MKKILIITALIMVSILALTACKSSETTTKTKTEAKAKTSKKDKDKKKDEVKEITSVDEVAPSGKTDAGSYKQTSDGKYQVTTTTGQSQTMTEDEFLRWYNEMLRLQAQAQTQKQGQGSGNKDKPTNPQPQTEPTTETPTQPQTQPQTEPETQWTPECPAYQNGYKHFWVPVQEYFQPIYEDRSTCVHCGTTMTPQEFAHHDCIDDGQWTGGLQADVHSVAVGEESIGIWNDNTVPDSYSRKGPVLYYECLFCGKRQ